MQRIDFPKIPGEHPLDTASRLVGGRSALAQHLNVTVAAVGNWKFRGVPIEKCTAIEFATLGAVRRQELCPNDWQNIWPELANPSTNTAEQGA